MLEDERDEHTCNTVRHYRDDGPAQNLKEVVGA